jgi:hexosaminidase
MSTIIPQPTHIKSLEGQFELLENASISANAGALAKAAQLAGFLRPATGFTLPVIESTGGAIHLELDSKIDGAETYELSVSNSRINLTASGEAGLFYAIQSLRQLLPTSIFNESKVENSWRIPCLEIEDAPCFAWRGAHLDVSRHFMPVTFVKKFIDLMALHKLNVFHWHLTDDQGWRLESLKYPRLTEVGAWRKQTMIGHGMQENPEFDGVPHGGFYTQDEASEIVAYAMKRHVTVMPEIELPGHAQAALAAYPEFGNTGEKLEVWGKWGINENVFNPLEPTILFLQDILSEVISIFPSQYIHVGGDECPKTQWEQSAAAQTRMIELGIPDEHALQSYFIGRMDKFLTAKGRRLVGWDEILEGGLTANATVMSWRGEEGGITAAKAGHDVIMTPGSHTYFDHYQSENTDLEPLAIGGFTPLEKVYGYEPIPPQLSDLEARHVLGSQAQHWTEYMKDAAHVEYMSFPRLSAFSEVVWSTKNSRNYDGFLTRLKPHLERLDLLKVNCRHG